MGRQKKVALDQLTLDALTAYALGMSYGKYKAQQYLKEREKK